MLTTTQRDMLQEILDCNDCVDVKQYQGPELARIKLLEKQGLVRAAYRLTPKGRQALTVKEESDAHQS